MTSAGGLVAAEQFVGKDSILSGPAGGVVGFSRVAQAAGFAQAIGFDMGGTSTDVSRFDGRFELEYETEKAGVRVVAPMMAIETVAAGGGSICDFDGAKLVVGPQSAGADPGPACYGRGGPLAVTDVNFTWARSCPSIFPFRSIDGQSKPRLQALINEIASRHVAAVHAHRAVRWISARGECEHGQGDPIDFDRQGMRSARLCAGRLRRRGGPARLRRGRRTGNSPDAAASRRGNLERVRHRRWRTSSGMRFAAFISFTRRQSCESWRQYSPNWRTRRGSRCWPRVAPERIEIRRSLDLRYQGLDAWLTIPSRAHGDLRRRLSRPHQKLYGYRQRGPRGRDRRRARRSGRPHRSRRKQHRSCAAHGRPCRTYGDGLLRSTRPQAGVFDRARLQPGNVHRRAGRCSRGDVDDRRRSRLARRDSVTR